ncbi:DUF924 family protein [Shewanella waksmanii]|uniref:DUF924 family protein n=1 Tax=Shewanella waksmanii TaxID=213783 RepID=UPI0037356BE5
MEGFLQQWFHHYQKGDGVEVNELSEATQVHWKTLLCQLKAGELDSWQNSPPGRLSLILLMGPVAHIFEDEHSISFQRRAHELCVSGVDKGFDTQLNPIQRRCFYDPLFYSTRAEDRALLIKLLDGMQFQVEQAVRPAWSNWYQQAQVS